MIFMVGFPGRYFVKKGCINLANLLVPPPSLNGTTHVIFLPEKSTLALAFIEKVNIDIINIIKVLNMKPPLKLKL